MPSARSPRVEARPVQALSVVSLLNGDTWVLGHYFDGRGSSGVDRGVVMKTTPGVGYCLIEDDSANCSP